MRSYLSTREDMEDAGGQKWLSGYGLPLAPDATDADARCGGRRMPPTKCRGRRPGRRVSGIDYVEEDARHFLITGRSWMKAVERGDPVGRVEKEISIQVRNKRPLAEDQLHELIVERGDQTGRNGALEESSCQDAFAAISDVSVI